MYIDLQYLFIHTVFKYNKKYRLSVLKYFTACQEEIYSDLLLQRESWIFSKGWKVWYGTWLFLFVKEVNNISLIKMWRLYEKVNIKFLESFFKKRNGPQILILLFHPFHFKFIFNFFSLSLPLGNQQQQQQQKETVLTHNRKDGEKKC